MRSSNPVFSREGSFTRDSGYAGFGPNGQAQYGANAGAPYGQNPYAGTQYAQPAPGQPPLTDEQLYVMYNGQSAGPAATGRMTLDDVVARTAICLLTVVAAGAVSWFTLPFKNFGFAVGASLVAMVIGLVVQFKEKISPGLILAYAAFEGFALGAITHFLNTLYKGIAIQAVLGTALVFGAMLFAFKSGKFRVGAKAARIGVAIGLAFSVLLLVNCLAWAFGGGLNTWGGPLGVGIGLVGIGLGAFFLAMDFTEIEQAIARGARQEESWRAAFGLTLSLVWIYIEMLRLIASLRGDD
ncbi:Bax inhibitor-1/YccA family protein [Streptomyces rubellomurinus]|uniref:Membrane protein n=2 Tax=Streptomyces TaxID=1883 RepID=A0A0F2T6I6_STRR3|nr:Bax inhibitor-1/YccA family protein [Streptomyces rubellomurinus]KJS54097.1 membrane protein [Streptomyces rubellomurinus subsp. indigoferus]KJS58828.1 membrane protein [Streptomyces rubellomurinus]